tara:strand:- start:36 stop:293 length:258 start_codon:yes stop_codon:yes gene_type:complete
MDWKKYVIFFISSFCGYFIGGWIAEFLQYIAPEFFNIDPSIFKVWLSRKPTMSSQILGYIIYAITALVMFGFSSILSELFYDDEK